MIFTEQTGTKQQHQSPENDEGFRHPAPTNQKAASIPTISKERIYNTQYYTRNVRHGQVTLAASPDEPFTALDAPLDDSAGSPGNKVCTFNIMQRGRILFLGISSNIYGRSSIRRRRS